VLRTAVNAGVDARIVTSLFEVEQPAPLREILQRMLRTSAACTLSRAVQFLGNRSAYYLAQLEELGLADVFFVNGVDPSHLGCFLAAPSPRRKSFHPRETRSWLYTAAHLVAAFRIRRQLGTDPGAVVDPNRLVPQAVLRPDGKLEHAEGCARSAPMRAALARATAAVDRARGPLRHRDPDEALEIWRALVAGEWSLVEHFDSDGRRFLIAHRNATAGRDARGLTKREQQVLAHADLGHSNKMIAYELGLSTSTVAGHLSRAREKLKLASATALHARS
jgi:DNA-binding CsgD family transcriptional regulator